MRTFIAQLNVTIGDFEGNLQKILNSIEQARGKEAELLIFPELAICGYPPEDLLTLNSFIQATEETLVRIIQASKGLSIIIGTVRSCKKENYRQLYNSAALIEDGSLVGYQDKILLPTYDVFDECRYFTPGQKTPIWQLGSKRFAVTICEDIWQHSPHPEARQYSRDPVLELAEQDFDYFVNISSSPYSFHKAEKRLKVLQAVASTVKRPVIFCNQVGGHDCLIFSGSSLTLNADGSIYKQAKHFSEDLLSLDLSQAPATHSPPEQIDKVESLYQALVLGVRDYFYKSGFDRACIGLSGGIDSALTAYIASEALGSDQILGISMPSRYSSEGSLTDSQQLAENLGIHYKEVSIETPFQSFLTLLTPQWKDLPMDVTEENMQARIRGLILMAFSNKWGYVVLSTGNKSEMAMGYTTLYGDMCGGLSVLGDVTKGQVYELARWINQKQELIPQSTIEKAPSAELRPNQKDSDSLPDYEIIDHVIKAYVEKAWSPTKIASHYNYSLELVRDLVQKIHRNEYKRRQAPLILRVSEKAFSAGRRFPIAHHI